MRSSVGIGITLKATPSGLCLLKRKRSQTQACNTSMWSYRVPEHVENGTVKAASQQVVEVVQLIAGVKSHVGKGHLHIVK